MLCVNEVRPSDNDPIDDGVPRKTSILDGSLDLIFCLDDGEIQGISKLIVLVNAERDLPGCIVG